jgi:hypothetical protein
VGQHVILPGNRAWLETLLKMEMRHHPRAGLSCSRHAPTPWLSRAPGCDACFRDLQAALRDTHRLFTQWKAWHARLAEWLAKAEPLGSA